jgi:ParB family chromosome partitioning protein
VGTERRLGRGLESLLGGGAEETGAPGAAKEVPVGKIRANPLQPRTAFAERDLSELAASIAAVGILQPLLVHRVGDGYELIAGERRLRAAVMAGLAVVPVVEHDAKNEDLLTLALTENLQREDLNPIEKARAFKNLLEKHNVTQEVAAKRIGKDRTTISNFVRLLDLPESVQHVVSRGGISMGHARALLAVPVPSAQQALALRIEEEGLSVREVERIAGDYRKGGQGTKRHAVAAKKSAHLRDLEQRAQERLGTKVVIEHLGGRGKMTIHFYSDDDFQRVLEVLGISG